MARNITSKLDVADGLDFSPDGGITEIALDKLIPYSRHPFKLYDGERLDDMVQSISKNGVITPIIVRTADNGKYEILAGHNRAYAAEKAGIGKIPAVVKTNLSDEEAEIYVIESNVLQRGFSDLKISEQAFAVAMRYNKLFDERKLKVIENELYIIENGKTKSDSESGNVPAEHQCTRDITAEEYGISPATVARLLRVNKLIPELKELVDKGNIKLRPAVDLSFLSEEHQHRLIEAIKETEVTVIDTKTARLLREISASYAVMTEETITEVLNGEYEADGKTLKDKGEKITLPTATYNRYLRTFSKKEANEVIERALQYYFENNVEAV